jgi:hypothetical protein
MRSLVGLVARFAAGRSARHSHRCSAGALWNLSEEDCTTLKDAQAAMMKQFLSRRQGKCLRTGLPADPIDGNAGVDGALIRVRDGGAQGPRRDQQAIMAARRRRQPPRPL